MVVCLLWLFKQRAFLTRLVSMRVESSVFGAVRLFFSVLFPFFLTQFLNPREERSLRCLDLFNQLRLYFVTILVYLQLHNKFDHLKKVQADEKKKMEEKRRMLVGIFHCSLTKIIQPN